MDLQPFAQVLSQDLVQDDLTLQSSQNRGHAGSYQRLLFQVKLVVLLSPGDIFACLCFAAAVGMQFLTVVPSEEALWSDL